MLRGSEVSVAHYQSSLDAVYAYEVPWSEFPTFPSYPHYSHPSQFGALLVLRGSEVKGNADEGVYVISRG